MVTFAKNPYSWVDDHEISSAVLRLDMTYKDKPFPATNTNDGIGVTVPTGVSLNPKSFTNATLDEKHDNTAVVFLDRVNPNSVLQLNVHIGTLTPEELQHFNDLSKMALKTPIIFDGYVNITLFRGNVTDAIKALEQNKIELFSPVYLYNFRFTAVCFYFA